MKEKKKRSENVQSAPYSATTEQASCCPDARTQTSVVKTAAQRKEYLPNLKNIRPGSTAASKLNDQASIFSGGEEEDNPGCSNRIESISQSPADKKSTDQISSEASKKEQYDKCVLKAQVEHHKAVSKKTDAEPLHPQNSYQHVKLNCRKIIVGTLKRTVVQPVILSLDHIEINLGKDANGFRLKTTEFTKWTYGFVPNNLVTFLKVTDAAYQKMESEIKWDRKEDNVWNCCTATNPEERKIVLIFEVCHDSDTCTIIEAIITNIGVRNNIPDFCEKITSTKVNSVLEALRKSAEVTSRESKHISESKMQLENEIQCQVIDVDSDQSDSVSTQVIVYPPPPAKGSIVVTNEDLQCLNEGKYLNDIIIDFYLKYLVLEKLKKEDAERTHVFSCFFYTCLKGKRNFQETSQLTIQQQRHKRVKRWTRHVDIFKKDFIFVPINEGEHWILAVICFPGLMKPEYELNPYSEETGISTICKQPCILLMNSLRMAFPSHIFQILREWLEVEWEVNKGTKRSFSEQAVRSFSLEVPQQNNFTDCGIYVLQYAESFFETPILNFDAPMNLKDWFPYSRVEKKREEIRNIILNLQ